MKTIISSKKVIYGCLGIMAMVSLSCNGNLPRHKVSDSFSVIETQFADPPADYRTAPFMVWNSKVTEADIDRMLQEFKDAGCGAAFVHPRSGLISEYMSDEWFGLFKYCVDKGKELGMNVWIYDENSYPSGFAGGHVPEQMPESYNQGQGLALEKVELLPEKLEPYYLCLKKEKNNDFKDITASVSDYKKQKGEYYLYRKTYFGKSDWYGGFSYVDLLVPGVTEKFIDITMKGYQENIKDEFNKTVKGIFSDEPNIGSPGGIRWTPDLFEVFRGKWGYDLKTNLPSLNEEVGDWKKVRHNYMETLVQLFIDRWSKPYHDYCQANDLKWTGHYWEHSWPDMYNGGDNMAMYAWHQVPAIDMLFNQFDETSPQAQFGNVRAVKELRSAANQKGYERTLSETYGGGGWEVTFKDLKRLGDWEYVLGVNFMNQHLAHMTLTGARKYDYPPVFTYHSPWWSHYKVLNDYYGRLSLVLSKGVQQNPILIIEPTSTLWSYYSYTGSNGKLMELGRAFQTFVTTLEKKQVEYDLGSENMIKDLGSIQKNTLKVGECTYQTVILPPATENLNAPTFTLLKEFVDRGGRLLAFSEPTMIDGKENEEVKALFSSAASNIIKVQTPDASVIKEYLSSTPFHITFEGGDLYHQRRNYKDGELLFLVNSSMTEAVTGRISMPGKTLLEMDAFTGQINAYPSESEEGVISASFRLEPAGSLLLFSSFKEKKGYKLVAKPVNGELLTAMDETMVQRVRDNALTIDFCDLYIGNEVHKDLHFSTAADMAFRHFGFINGNPWNTSVQYKRNILDRDTFKTGEIKAVYHLDVADKFDYSTMKLVTERPSLWKVSVNGKPVTANPGQWWLDISFGVYNIGDYIKAGKNVIETCVEPMSIYAEIEPVYITGDFSVLPVEKGWAVYPPEKQFALGSWKQQGQPFYSWEMGYGKHYEIADTGKPCKVKLNKWTGTVAEVLVNGISAGIIAFDPYELDITSHLRKGKNRIEVRVTGSLKNLLGPHHRNPAPGLASPWHWKGVTQYISGRDYQMLDYGLMEDFEVYQ